MGTGSRSVLLDAAPSDLPLQMHLSRSPHLSPGLPWAPPAGPGTLRDKKQESRHAATLQLSLPQCPLDP